MSTAHLARKHFRFVFVLALGASLLVGAVPHGPRMAERQLPAADGGARTTLRPPAPTTARADVEQRARAAYAQLGVSFEENRGQTDARVKFIARRGGQTVFLTSDAAWFVLSAPLNAGAQLPGTLVRHGHGTATTEPRRTRAVRMGLAGANPRARVVGERELAGRVNYFRGHDPAKWQTEVKTYGGVRYEGIYEGVDLVYYGNEHGELEYDFRVAPGADAGKISLRISGAEGLEVDAAGDLLIRTPAGALRQRKPIVYQETAGRRVEIESSYAVSAGGRVGFTLGEYDTRLPLVIDPTLVYSTYLGGSSTDLARAIAVDAAGNAYITGYTRSTDFPTANALQGTSGGPDDVFVTKINAAGTAYVYSTYLGGSSREEARGIAADSAGNAYVTGFTSSANFPTANAIQGTLDVGGQDAFVTKLNAAGSALVYSTFLGGVGEFNSADFGEAIAVDSSGNAYVTGSTFSNNFPTVNAIQATFGGGSTDGFVTKINAAGTAFVYSTYLGGNGAAAITGVGGESGRGIAADAAGNAYVTGEINSTNFPTANAIQATYGGGGTDAFVTKINAAGSALIYSTYLGGDAQDSGEGIKADASGNAYVAGFTVSTNFPVANALQGTNGGTTTTQDAFVTKINAAGSAFIYSTYLGGTGGEIAFGIAVDAAGNAYVGGSTNSLTSFPVANAIQCARNGGQDIFITKLNAAGSAFVYSTYLGGSGSDDGQGIALDSSNNAYITGSTTSTDFPTVNPIQSANSGGTPFGDAFVTKLNDALAPNSCATPTPTPTPTPTATPTPTPTVTAQFTGDAFPVNEGAGSIRIDVTLSAPAPGPATVDYGTNPDANVVRCDTVNGSASERCDFTTTVGTLRFATGEQSKSFTIFITDDAFLDGVEVFGLSLSNPTGGIALGTPSTAIVTISDNDTNPNAPNPIDNATFFVQMHYIDFLNRQGETAGVTAWVNQLNNCPAGAQTCDRVETSSRFFRSDEFMLKGAFVIRYYKASLGTNPSYREFTRDSQRVTGATAAEVIANRDAFSNEWVQRADFKAIYDGLSNQAYVDKIEQTAGVTLQNKQQLVNNLNTGAETRAQVLRDIVESNEVKAKMYNDAFVLMEYFGYLRRDAEPAGFNAWLNYLNAHPQDFRTMVNGFMNSIEYRLRFGRP